MVFAYFYVNILCPHKILQQRSKKTLKQVWLTVFHISYCIFIGLLWYVSTVFLSHKKVRNIQMRTNCLSGWQSQHPVRAHLYALFLHDTPNTQDIGDCFVECCDIFFLRPDGVGQFRGGGLPIWDFILCHRICTFGRTLVFKQWGLRERNSSFLYYNEAWKVL